VVNVDGPPDNLAREMREALASFTLNGVIAEVVELAALIARRTAP
jgi:hypothetical protein